MNPSFGGVAEFLEEEANKEKSCQPSFGGVAEFFMNESDPKAQQNHERRQSFGHVFGLLEEEKEKGTDSDKPYKPSYGGVAEFFNAEETSESSGHGRKKSSFSGVVNLFFDVDDNESSISSEMLQSKPTTQWGQELVIKHARSPSIDLD